MARNRSVRKSTVNYKKIGAVLLVLAVVFLPALQLVKKLLPGKDAKAFKNDVEKIAFQIAEHMGTIYPIYDPRAWVENDDDVIKLIDENRKEYKSIATQYTRITGGKRLSEDVVKYIDDYSQIADVI